MMVPFGDLGDIQRRGNLRTKVTFPLEFIGPSKQRRLVCITWGLELRIGNPHGRGCQSCGLFDLLLTVLN